MNIKDIRKQLNTAPHEFISYPSDKLCEHMLPQVLARIPTKDFIVFEENGQTIFAWFNHRYDPTRESTSAPK